MKCIVHIDLDCFYAQVEAQRVGVDCEKEPFLLIQWGMPLAVSYPARKFGITRSGHVTDAIKLCPHVKFTHAATYKLGETLPRYHPDPSRATHKVSLLPYRSASRKIFSVFKSFRGVSVEKGGVDEAFLDVTEAAEEAIRLLSDQFDAAFAEHSLDESEVPPVGVSSTATSTAPATQSSMQEDHRKGRLLDCNDEMEERETGGSSGSANFVLSTQAPAVGGLEERDSDTPQVANTDSSENCCVAVAEVELSLASFGRKLWSPPPPLAPMPAPEVAPLPPNMPSSVSSNVCNTAQLKAFQDRDRKRMEAPHDDEREEKEGVNDEIHGFEKIPDLQSPPHKIFCDSLVFSRRVSIEKSALHDLSCLLRTSDLLLGGGGFPLSSETEIIGGESPKRPTDTTSKERAIYTAKKYELIEEYLKTLNNTFSYTNVYKCAPETVDDLSVRKLDRGEAKTSSVAQPSTPQSKLLSRRGLPLSSDSDDENTLNTNGEKTIPPSRRNLETTTPRPVHTLRRQPPPDVMPLLDMETYEERYKSLSQDPHCRCLLHAAAVITKIIRDEVRARLGFNCSAGVSFNKAVSKCISAIHKPNQQTVLPPEDTLAYLSDLPYQKLRGLGGKLGKAVMGAVFSTYQSFIMQYQYDHRHDYLKEEDDDDVSDCGHSSEEKCTTAIAGMYEASAAQPHSCVTGVTLHHPLNSPEEENDDCSFAPLLGQGEVRGGSSGLFTTPTKSHARNFLDEGGDSGHSHSPARRCSEANAPTDTNRLTPPQHNKGARVPLGSGKSRRAMRRSSKKAHRELVLAQHQAILASIAALTNVGNRRGGKRPRRERAGLGVAERSDDDDYISEEDEGSDVLLDDDDFLYNTERRDGGEEWEAGESGHVVHERDLIGAPQRGRGRGRGGWGRGRGRGGDLFVTDYSTVAISSGYREALHSVISERRSAVELFDSSRNAGAFDCGDDANNTNKAIRFGSHEVRHPKRTLLSFGINQREGGKGGAPRMCSHPADGGELAEPESRAHGDGLKPSGPEASFLFAIGEEILKESSASRAHSSLKCALVSPKQSPGQSPQKSESMTARLGMSPANPSTSSVRAPAPSSSEAPINDVMALAANKPKAPPPFLLTCRAAWALSEAALREYFKAQSPRASATSEHIDKTTSYVYQLLRGEGSDVITKRTAAKSLMSQKVLTNHEDLRHQTRQDVQKWVECLAAELMERYDQLVDDSGQTVRAKTLKFAFGSGGLSDWGGIVNKQVPAPDHLSTGSITACGMELLNPHYINTPQYDEMSLVGSPHPKRPIINCITVTISHFVSVGDYAARGGGGGGGSDMPLRVGGRGNYERCERSGGILSYFIRHNQDERKKRGDVEVTGGVADASAADRRGWDESGEGEDDTDVRFTGYFKGKRHTNPSAIVIDDDDDDKGPCDGESTRNTFGKQRKSSKNKPSRGSDVGDSLRGGDNGISPTRRRAAAGVLVAPAATAVQTAPTIVDSISKTEKSAAASPLATMFDAARQRLVNQRDPARTEQRAREEGCRASGRGICPEVSTRTSTSAVGPPKRHPLPNATGRNQSHNSRQTVVECLDDDDDDETKVKPHVGGTHAIVYPCE